MPAVLFQDCKRLGRFVHIKLISMELTAVNFKINGLRVTVLPYLPFVYGVYRACDLSTRQEFDYRDTADMLHDKQKNILYVSGEVMEMIKKEYPQWPKNGSNI